MLDQRPQTTGARMLRVEKAGRFVLMVSQLRDAEFQLRRPVAVVVLKEPSGYIVSSSELNVHAFGATLSEAQEEWEEVLTDLFLSYTETPEEQLAPSGRVMRDNLSAVVFEVS